jgi:hypothetical protein
VKDHLPQRLRASVGRKMTDATHHPVVVPSAVVPLRRLAGVTVLALGCEELCPGNHLRVLLE